MSKIISLRNLLRNNKIPECLNSTTNRDECLLSGIRNVIKHAVGGIPDMGIPPSEPLFVKESNFVEHNVNGTLYNTKVYGLTKLELKHFKSNLEKLVWFCSVYFPKIRFLSNYVFTTTVLIIPITMRGVFECTLYAATNNCTVYGKLFRESDEDFLKLEKVTMEIKFHDYVGEFDPGSRNIIINQINYLFNRSDQKEIFKRDFKRQLENITEDTFMKIVSPFIARVKFSEFYPTYKDTIVEQKK